MIGRARPADAWCDVRQRRLAPAGLTRNGAHAAPTDTPPKPRGDEEELYRRHHRELHRAVSRAVHAPRELIEDACQTAWAILLRRQPDRDAIFAWLRVVAIREAYRLSAIDRRDARLERLRSEDGAWQEVMADARSLDAALEALEALRALALRLHRSRRRSRSGEGAAWAPASAARGTSTSSDPSAPTTSSTTRRRTSPRASSATT